MKVCKAHLDNEQFLEWIQLLIFTKPFWDNAEAYKGMLAGRKDFDTNPRPQPLHGLRGQAAACVGHDTHAKLGKIKAPCLVIGGKDQVLLNFQDLERLKGPKTEAPASASRTAAAASSSTPTTRSNKR
jgi:pimeloyl-ACP methyl ester carboxylesterase